MLKYLFVALLLLHGLIHLLGFVKAFNLGEVSQLTQAIPRPTGALWLAVTLLFLISAGAYLTVQAGWPVIVLPAVILSQILIFSAWQDARFGTLANVIILIVALAGFAAWQYERSYRQDVQENMARVQKERGDILTEDDLAHLPPPVQRHLHFTGVVGKPLPTYFRVRMHGQMRDREKDWFSFSTEQYNFLPDPARLFFMKAQMKGLPVSGYHHYEEGKAGMEVKLLSLFPVVDLQSDTLFRAETVTFFNDLCLMAPALLVDDRIRWEAIDDTTARATFTTRGTSISATLHFAKNGRLLNFISDDRYDVTARQQYRFSTPLSDYRDFGGYRLPAYGEAVWHYPEGEFVYGKFHLEEITYDPQL